MVDTFLSNHLAMFNDPSLGTRNFVNNGSRDLELLVVLYKYIPVLANC